MVPFEFKFICLKSEHSAPQIQKKRNKISQPQQKTEPNLKIPIRFENLFMSVLEPRGFSIAL